MCASGNILSLQWKLQPLTLIPEMPSAFGLPPPVHVGYGGEAPDAFRELKRIPPVLKDRFSCV